MFFEGSRKPVKPPYFWAFRCIDTHSPPLWQWRQGGRGAGGRCGGLVGWLAGWLAGGLVGWLVGWWAEGAKVIGFDLGIGAYTWPIPRYMGLHLAYTWV